MIITSFNEKYNCFQKFTQQAFVGNSLPCNLFLLIFPLILTFSPWEKGTAWAWYDGAWNYRRPVTVSGSTAGAQTNYQVAVDPGIYDNTGLVGSWHFSEGSGTSAFDMSGNGNNGTLTNGPIWTTGRFGNTLSFDGVDDYADAGNNPSLTITSGGITLEAWINLTSVVRETIIAKDVTNLSNGNYLLTIENGRLRFSFYDGVGVNKDYYTTDAVISVGVWQHVALVHIWGNGTSTKIFVNSTQQTGSWTSGTGNEIPIAGQNLWIGDSHYSGQMIFFPALLTKSKSTTGLYQRLRLVTDTTAVHRKCGMIMLI